MKTWKVKIYNQSKYFSPSLLEKDSEYWSTFAPDKFGVGLDVQYETEDTSITIRHTGKRKSDGRLRFTTVGVREQLDHRGYDEVIFIYDEEDTAVGRLTKKNKEKDMYVVSTCPYGLKDGASFLEIAVESKKMDIGGTINHERFHSLERHFWASGVRINDQMDKTIVGGKIKRYYKNKDIYALDGNRAYTLRAWKPYWHTLKTVSDTYVEKLVKKVITPQIGYKYFTAQEVLGLDRDFVLLLDKARGIAGIPFVITSGLRTQADNKRVGGVEDSSHLTGKAVDLRVRSSAERYKILTALLEVGFTRLGIYEGHIHVDMDSTKSKEVVWYK